MTDKELLELAAKAAGIKHHEHMSNGVVTGGLWLVNPNEPHEYAYRYWNPLTYDGDALRLAFMLKIDIEWQNVGEMPEPFVQAYRCSDDEFYSFISEHETAYRRAIVNVAAQIGKAMP